MSGEQDATTSDIFHPDWKPGRGMMRRAGLRAERLGIPFDEALEQCVARAKESQLRNMAKAQRSEVTPEERSIRRAQRKRARTPLIGEAGRSVRTVSGGLPSLGKRR